MHGQMKAVLACTPVQQKHAANSNRYMMSSMPVGAAGTGTPSSKECDFLHELMTTVVGGL